MRKSDCSHKGSEENSRDIFLKGRARQKRCDRPLLLRVSASFASSEAMFFVLYGPLVSLVVQLYVLVSLARP